MNKAYTTIGDLKRFLSIFKDKDDETIITLTQILIVLFPSYWKKEEE